MPINERANLSAILQKISDNLDIPDYAYEDATLKYEDVGEHLASEESELYSYKPEVYVQGSFRLGTMVQPYGRNDEYDIDLVCQLNIKKESVTQSELKSRVGNRLKVRHDLAAILKASRRCWILDYQEKSGMPAFHMDVLPSIHNEEQPPTGILLTDTELTRWQKSNPIAYAEWFKKKMEVVFRLRKMALAESLQASVEDVPDWRVKTPLQRCVQILKRHRDIHFENDADNKPVSIILTTLAAHAYKNEDDIFEALIGITRRMPSYIENRNGIWWVENPVENGENFADKWNEYPKRRDSFLKWLSKVEADFKGLSYAKTTIDGLSQLEKSIGQQIIEKTASDLGVRRANLLPAVN
ncbi:MAG: nucleotidyltransferase, partial [Sedimentisphaerales bacterium]